MREEILVVFSAQKGLVTCDVQAVMYDFSSFYGMGLTITGHIVAVIQALFIDENRANYTC